MEDRKFKLDNTNFLLEDSVSCTGSRHLYSSYIRKNDNTENLINEKTSILQDNNLSKINEGSKLKGMIKFY